MGEPPTTRRGFLQTTSLGRSAPLDEAELAWELGSDGLEGLDGNVPRNAINLEQDLTGADLRRGREREREEMGGDEKGGGG